MKSLPLLGLLMLNLFAASEPEPNPQVLAIVNDSLPAGKLYAKMFATGLDAESLTDLGTLFRKEGKPLHALEQFQKALTLQPENQAAKAAKDEALARVAYLEERIKVFQEKFNKDGKVTDYCSAAAILFHLGRGKEAFQLLGQFLEKNSNEEVSSLQFTFMQGLNMRGMAAQILQGSFHQAVSEKDLEQALTILGQIQFVTLNTYPTETLVQQLGLTFGNQLNAMNVNAVLKNPAKS